MSEHAAVVYPAEFSSHYALEHGIPDLHTTIFNLGKVAELDYIKEDVVEALTEVDFNMFIWVDIIATERFGPDKDIPVLRVRHDMLQTKFDEVNAVLLGAGIPNGSIFAHEEYKPHITVNEEVFASPPKNALLSPAELWWGGVHERLV